MIVFSEGTQYLLIRLDYSKNQNHLRLYLCQYDHASLGLDIYRNLRMESLDKRENIAVTPVIQSSDVFYCDKNIIYI